MKKIALSILAIASAASAWAIQGTVVSSKNGSSSGDVKWVARDKTYVVTVKRGQTEMQTSCELADLESLDIPRPAALDKAIEAVQNGQGASAIPALSKIVNDYKMLVWDKTAARYLVQAYLAANNPQKAEEEAKKLLADDRDAAWKGDFAPAYWQVLLKLGKLQPLENNLRRAAASGDRAASAEALCMRGDLILSQGGDSPDTYRKALTDAYLRVALMYLDEPCRDARFNALNKAAGCFDKLGMAVRAEDMRNRAKAM